MRNGQSRTMNRSEMARRAAVPRAARTALVSALVAAGAACGSGAPEPPAQLLDSRVPDPSIRVDGYRSDWEGNLTRVGDRDVFAGFHRGEGALYMAVVSQDRGFDVRVFRSGLTVWFDTAGTRRRARGIRFPVFGPEARKRLRADTAGGQPDRERLLRAAGSDFVVVGEDGEESLVSPGEAEGLEVAAAIDRGLFTWELRLPLERAGGPVHALPTAAGDTISVGLQAGGDQGELVRPPASPAADSTAAADTMVADTMAADTVAADSSAAAGEERPARPPRRRLPGTLDVPELEVWLRVNLAGPGSG